MSYNDDEWKYPASERDVGSSINFYWQLDPKNISEALLDTIDLGQVIKSIKDQLASYLGCSPGYVSVDEFAKNGGRQYSIAGGKTLTLEYNNLHMKKNGDVLRLGIWTEPVFKGWSRHRIYAWSLDLIHTDKTKPGDMFPDAIILAEYRASDEDSSAGSLGLSEMRSHVQAIKMMNGEWPESDKGENK